ncbi:MAG: hypothetical protein KIH08_16705 [Candidatus Freyarchaeota archaeon]|nr:hypothetical protein [Candidatus Jordarchaeia archaeon]MBS7270606.1 hypothetical protein [Candidatus Jordarchaeia archaeon]MBS7281471.1 hypothetical protein [Candidatus Jordarchaeia archaeon]
MGNYEDISGILMRARNQIAKILGMWGNLSPAGGDFQRLLDLRSQLFKVEQDIKLGGFTSDDSVSRVLGVLLSHSCRLFLESLNQLSLEPNSQSLFEEVLNSYGNIESLINYGKTTGQISSPDDFISSLEEKYPTLILEIRKQRPHFPYDVLGIPTPRLKEEVVNLVQKRGKISVEEIAKQFSLKPDEVIGITNEPPDKEKPQTIHTKDKKSLMSWEWATEEATKHFKKEVDIPRIAQKLNIKEEDAIKITQNLIIQKLDKTTEKLEPNK